MRKLLLAAIVMSSLIGTQVVAEARGGNSGGSFSGGGAGMMNRRADSLQGMRDMSATRQQDRLRDPSLVGDHIPGSASGDQLGTKQRLRDPELHTDLTTMPTQVVEN